MTLIELKRRYETSDKLTKPAKRQIKAQLARKCSVRGCNESLAFERADKIVCNADHRKSSPKRKTKAEMRKINHDKKKRFEAKHGIVRNKTVRNRDAKASGSGVDYDGRTLLYEHYKEPLKQIEKGKGYGYYGTVALTEDKEFVQCHICGNLYPNVGAHLRKHKITAEKYKETYGLAQTTALISEPVREMYQQKVVAKLKSKGLPEWLKEYNGKVQSGEIKHKTHGRTTMPLEKRNEKGLCPDQVLEKIRDLGDKLGKTPSYDEFQAEHKGRYLGSIKFQHGSWSNAVRKAYKHTREDLRRLDKDRLIEELQEFYKAHERIPMTSDFNRGMLRNRGSYISTFGSLNNARIEAGMNAVLPLPFGQVVELTPEQYFEYQKGHDIGIFSKLANKRRLKRKKARVA